VFFAMARDGLLPRFLAGVDRRGVPKAVTILTGFFAAIIAGLVPLDDIASVANAGTLAAFIATAFAVMVLRRRAPELTRPFRTPVVWIVAPFAVLGCLYLFSSLRTITMVFFFAWNAIGLVVYLLYSREQSLQKLTS
jgi:APA family basic amino acid/polyamine antiporter